MSSYHTQHDRSQMELPKLDTTQRLTDAFETLLESFKAEQASRKETMQQMLKETELLKEHDTAASLGQLSTTETVLVNRIESLKHQLELLKEERVFYEQHFKRLLGENNILKAQTRELENQVSTLTSSSDDLLENVRIEKPSEEQLETLHKLLEERDETTRNIETAFNKAVDDRDALRRKGNDLEKERDKFKRDMDILKIAHEKERRKVVAHLVEISDLKQENEEYKTYNQRLQQEKWKLEAELTEQKKRLTRQIGSKLSDNNPDKVDLNDMNRPTKLAEKYTELYDNEWTDAFEVVFEVTDETTGINILLTLLQDIHVFCGGLADTQAKQLTKALLMTYQEREKSLPEDVYKQLKDFRKSVVETTLPEVQEKCLSEVRLKDYPTLLKDERIKPFVSRCIELCWLMSVQDPPIVFGEAPASMEAFDTNTYKHYTRNAPYIQYLVWPVLYLHKGGPLLCKGVAQGYGKHKKSSAKQRFEEVPPTKTTMPGNYHRVENEPRKPPKIKAIERNKDRGYEGNSSSSHRQYDQTQNYEKTVFGSTRVSPDHVRTYNRASKETESASVAETLNKTASAFRRKKLPALPDGQSWDKFNNYRRLYGVDSTEIKTGLGEKYDICRDYYEYIFEK